VYLASVICGTPIAMVSLVDDQRQWFKARVGMDEQETSRDIAFCAHAILGPEPMVVPDATLDPRFADSPLVTENPNIRFYAGAPLTTADGHSIGSMCVMDREPREMSTAQLDCLRALSRQVMVNLEQRRIGLILSSALDRAQTLSGLLPICAYCKRVREDQDYWREVESYFKAHSDLEFSHAICPKCVLKHFPDLT
jgi:GAF domain-containing protein